VLGTVNCSTECGSALARECVVVTSDKCYDTARPGPHRETDPIGGDDVYARARGAAEMITASYLRRLLPAGASRRTRRRAGVRARGQRDRWRRLVGRSDWSPDAIRALTAKPDD